MRRKILSLTICLFLLETVCGITYSNTENSEFNNGKHKPIYDDGFVKSNLVTMSENEIDERFGKFKITDATKVIYVDNLSYIKLGYFENDRAFVTTTENGTFCIDGKGNIIKRFEKEELPNNVSFGAGRVILYDSNRIPVIYDTNFKAVKKLVGCTNFTNYNNDGVAMIVHSTAKTKSNLKYIDINGNFVFSNINMGLSHLDNRTVCDGLAVFPMSPTRTTNKTYYGFRDAKGNVVIDAKYEDACDFSNGLAAVAMTSEHDNVKKWGFIDTSGNLVIPYMFSKQPSCFDVCGLAMVQDKEGMYMFINKKGNVVSEKFGYKDFTDVTCITPFCNGYSLLKEKDSRIFLINSNFEKVKLIDEQVGVDYHNIKGLELLNPMSYYGKKELNGHYSNEKYVGRGEGERIMIRNGRFYIKLGSKTGKNYKTIARDYARLTITGDADFTCISGYFHNGIAPVHNSTYGVGYVNEKGEWIVKFERNQF